MQGTLKDKGGCRFVGDVLLICGNCELVIVESDHCVPLDDPQYRTIERRCSEFALVTRLQNCGPNRDFCEFVENEEGAEV